MGQSTDAIIGYGYCWQNEDAEVPWEGGEVEWDEILARKRGAVNPWDAHYDASGNIADGMSYDEFKKANKAAIDKWDLAREAVKLEFNIEVGSHCSVDYPMPYVAYKPSHERAWRGSPKDLTELFATVSVTDAALAEARDHLDRFFAEFDFDPTEEPEYGDPQLGPCWFLCSDWG